MAEVPAVFHGMAGLTLPPGKATGCGGERGLGQGISLARDGGTTQAAGKGPCVGGTPKGVLKPHLWCCRKPLRASWGGQAQGVPAQGGYPHARAMGAGWGEDASPPSALSFPPSKPAVSPGVLAKATLLHKHTSWLGSRAVPSPGGMGTPRAPVGMMQLTLSPWVLASPGHNGSTRAEGCSPALRETGGHPAATSL